MTTLEFELLGSVSGRGESVGVDSRWFAWKSLFLLET